MASRAFSYILFFSFHLYIVSSANISTPSKFLNELNGVQKGNQRSDVERAKKYLAHFGYMTTCPRNFINKESKNTVDKCLELALKKYQKFYHLKITGVLDEATIKKMRKPRCGVPDFYPAKHNKTAFHEHYAFLSGKPFHPKGDIPYAFTNVKEEYIPAMENALRKWESVAHFIKFTRATDHSKAKIRISFKPKSTFDDVETLAFTLLPGEQVHINEDIKWSTTRAPDTYDIESIFLHEIGHALGLAHSQFEQASMYAEFAPRQVRGLHKDDITGIKILYY